MDYGVYRRGACYSMELYGKNSRRATIKAIQKSVGVQVTGNTTDAMYKKITPVRLGSSGNFTKCLQGLLFIHGFNPQELGGNCTEVVAFTIGKYQRSAGLKYDEIGGKDTFKKLIG